MNSLIRRLELLEASTTLVSDDGEKSIQEKIYEEIMEGAPPERGSSHIWNPELTFNENLYLEIMGQK